MVCCDRQHCACPGAAPATRPQIRALFVQLGQRLDGGARPYLVGDSFTAADLTFASMAALVLQPEQYGGTPPATVSRDGVQLHDGHESGWEALPGAWAV